MVITGFLPMRMAIGFFGIFNMQYKIKIAYIIDSINSVAGTEKQLIQMLQKLDQDLFDTKLICLRKPSAVFKIEKKPFEYVELDLHKLISFKALIILVWLALYLRRGKIDIIQTYFFDATIIGVLAGKIARVEKIISCRRDLGFWYTPTLLRILKIINRMTTRILANSYAVKEQISMHENISEDKIDVIKNGINFNSFGWDFRKENLSKSIKISDEDYVVGIVANLNRPVKRIDVFIKAASEVLKLIPNVSFLIVGDGHLRDELGKLVKRLDICKKIFFLGRRNEIESIIGAWDVGVISSDSEGFSNSILEYMAAGIPVVATEVGGNKELIEQGVNGVLIAPGDYESMAEQICALLNDRRRRLQMAENAKSLIRREYSWVNKIIEIESYYYNLSRNNNGK